jgi:predicted HicB family RNase H-like nuclease
VGANEGMLQLELTSATLKDVMAAAEASGQSVSEWIRSAVDEAIARRS